MHSPQEITRLMGYSETKRIFILEALDYIDKVIEESLYTYDEGFSRKEIEIGWKDILLYVFCWEYRGGKLIAVGWKGNKFEERIKVKPIPNEVSYKSWEEIYKSLESDPYRETELKNWFDGLKKELEIKGFSVRDIYPFERDSLRVRWNKTF